MQETQESIDLFFQDHRVKADTPGMVSPLYLAKREISRCFGEDPDSGNETDQQSLIPGTLSVLTAIDLLSQCYFGSLKTKGTSKRFMIFMQNYFRLRPDEQEAMYRFRSALTHTFGTYSFDESRKKEYRFKIQTGDSPLIEKMSNTVYHINITALKDQFFKVSEKYYYHLGKSMALQQKFFKVYRKIGKLYIESL